MARRLLDWAMELVGTSRKASALRDKMRRSRMQCESSPTAPRVGVGPTIGDGRGRVRIVSAVPMGPLSERRQLIPDLLREAADAGLRNRPFGRAYAALANIAFEQSDWAVGVDVAQRAADHFDRAGLLKHKAWASLLGSCFSGAPGNCRRSTRVPDITRQFRELDDEFGLGYSLWFAALRASTSN